MWPLDSLTKLSTNVSTNLQNAMKEGFGPVANIASTIGNTIGTVTGTINESKALAEQEAKKNVAISKEATETADTNISNTNDASSNPVAIEKPMDKTAYALIIIKYIVVYTFTFFFAMLVANQLIFEPAVYRTIIFIFIILIPFLFSAIGLIPFALYYIGLMLWRIYLRSTPEYKDKKISLLPKIYCMLPLTTVEGTNAFERFFKYPFYFPQSEVAEKRLQKEQEIYENELIGSFYKWNEITKKYPEFSNQFKLVSQKFKEMVTRIPAAEPVENDVPVSTGSEIITTEINTKSSQ